MLEPTQTSYRKQPKSLAVRRNMAAGQAARRAKEAILRERQLDEAEAK